jgi:hypothetical protein
MARFKASPRGWKVSEGVSAAGHRFYRAQGVVAKYFEYSETGLQKAAEVHRVIELSVKQAITSAVNDLPSAWNWRSDPRERRRVSRASGGVVRSRLVDGQVWEKELPDGSTARMGLGVFEVAIDDPDLDLPDGELLEGEAIGIIGLPEPGDNLAGRWSLASDEEAERYWKETTEP